MNLKAFFLKFTFNPGLSAKILLFLGSLRNLESEGKVLRIWDVLNCRVLKIVRKGSDNETEMK